MSNFFKSKSILVAFSLALMAFNCSSDDNTDLEIPDGSSFDAELFVSEAGNDMRNVTTSVNVNTGTSIKSKVKFSTTTDPMRRLYITQEVNGAAAVPFVFTNQEVDEKADGSLDLGSGDKKDFEFQIDLPAPAMNEGSIVYTFWATTGRGDFRDISKRNAIDANAIGTITVNGGGSNTESDLREYIAIMLAAPLADERSNTFMSLFDGEKYMISEGEETAALWDLGYFYGASLKASFASTKDYPNNVINVPEVSKVADEELNATYFALSTSFTERSFDAIKSSSELNVITSPTKQRVNGLKAGDIVEVVTKYGKKGLMKITNIVPGDGSTGRITFTVKIQS
ncbi:hypothetical protein [Flavivirga aquatica]|nr:hypothetical protein [Flavivirga aquatica]